MLVKVVIIGLGIQGTKRLAIAESDGVATVDPVNPKAQFCNIEEVPFESYDAALICTPDSVKIGLLEYLLGHGKHVLVEKPLLSENEESLYRLERLARTSGATCYTAYNHRFEPHVMRLKELLDSGTIGAVYLARFFYGNGTARDVRVSPWRDKGLGVLPDLGSHLLDMVLFLFGESHEQFEPWSFNRFENRSLDHVLFGCGGTPVMEMEVSLLSWRNTFTVDVFGEEGSAHIHGLCKWGPSSFTVRNRRLPSGKPDEETATEECLDPTWAAEYEYFKGLCATGESNLRNDFWVNSVLNGLARKIGDG